MLLCAWFFVLTSVSLCFFTLFASEQNEPLTLPWQDPSGHSLFHAYPFEKGSWFCCTEKGQRTAQWIFLLIFSKRTCLSVASMPNTPGKYHYKTLQKKASGKMQAFVGGKRKKQNQERSFRSSVGGCFVTMQMIALSQRCHTHGDTGEKTFLSYLHLASLSLRLSNTDHLRGSDLPVRGERISRREPECSPISPCHSSQS